MDMLTAALQGVSEKRILESIDTGAGLLQCDGGNFGMRHFNTVADVNGVITMNEGSNKPNVGLWLFNELEGQECRDLVGTAHATSSSTGVSIVDGPEPGSKAKRFDGVTGSADFFVPVIPLGQKAIKMRVKFPAPVGVEGVLLDNTGGVVNSHGHWISAYDTKVRWRSTFGHATEYRFDLQTKTNIMDNQFHTLVFTWDGTPAKDAVRIYVDGVLDAATSATAPENVVASKNMRIGAIATSEGTPPSLFLDYTIDQLEVFSYVDEAPIGGYVYGYSLQEISPTNIYKWQKFFFSILSYAGSTAKLHLFAPRVVNYGFLRDGGFPAGEKNSKSLLAENASSTSNHYVGHFICISGGTGTGQMRKIAAYDSLTKVVTLDRVWDIVPDVNSEYEIYKCLIENYVSGTKITDSMIDAFIYKQVIICLELVRNNTSYKTPEVHPITWSWIGAKDIGHLKEAFIQKNVGFDNVLTNSNMISNNNVLKAGYQEPAFNIFEGKTCTSGTGAANPTNATNGNLTDTARLQHTADNRPYGVIDLGAGNAKVIGHIRIMNQHTGMAQMNIYNPAWVMVSASNDGSTWVEIEAFSLDPNSLTHDLYLSYLMSARYWRVRSCHKMTDQWYLFEILGYEYVPETFMLQSVEPSSVYAWDKLIYTKIVPPGSDVKVHLVDADIRQTGLVVSAGVQNVRMRNSESETNDYYKGWYVIISRGTGNGQVRKITAYNGTNRVATVAEPWAVSPDTTSTYILVYPIKEDIPSGTQIYNVIDVMKTKKFKILYAVKTPMSTSAAFKSAEVHSPVLSWYGEKNKMLFTKASDTVRVQDVRISTTSAVTEATATMMRQIMLYKAGVVRLKITGRHSVASINGFFQIFINGTRAGVLQVASPAINTDYAAYDVMIGTANRFIDLVVPAGARLDIRGYSSGTNVLTLFSLSISYDDINESLDAVPTIY